MLCFLIDFFFYDTHIFYSEVHRENCTENPFCWEYPDAMMTPEQRITIIESLGKDFALEKREVYTAPKDKKSKTETQSQATLIQFPVGLLVFFVILL